jgi:hypothetical protein
LTETPGCHYLRNRNDSQTNPCNAALGCLPEWASELFTYANAKELEAWCEAVLTAPTLEAVFNKSDVP